MADNDVHNCHACHMLTSRTCSVCGVCVFCSMDCEQRAAKVSYARIACAEHMKGLRVPENLGTSAIHYVMLPRTPIDAHTLQRGKLGADQLSQRTWEILFHGAKHYMHLLLAASPSILFEKTAFGMSVVLMGAGYDNLSAGFQRLNYPLGTPEQAAAMVLANATKLAHAQLCDAFHKRAVFVVGTTVLEPSPIVHFDAVYAVLNYGKWTIKGIKPVWAQTLTYTNNRHYKMHFRPNGHVPMAPLHTLALVEEALVSPRPPADPSPAHPQPPTPSETPQARPQATPAPAPPTAPVPPLSPLREEEEEKVPSREAMRAQALAAAKASKEAPPWTQQLLKALPQM